MVNRKTAICVSLLLHLTILFLCAVARLPVEQPRDINLLALPRQTYSQEDLNTLLLSNADYQNEGPYFDFDSEMQVAAVKLAVLSSDTASESGSIHLSGHGFWGQILDGNSIVFVVDRSGSMTGSFQVNTTKLEIVSFEIQRWLNEVATASNRCGFVCFNPVRCYREEPTPISNINSAEVRDWLDKQAISYSSSTPLRALARAAAMKPDCICLLTDGFHPGLARFSQKCRMSEIDFYIFALHVPRRVANDLSACVAAGKFIAVP